jgi:hypothetical protein
MANVIGGDMIKKFVLILTMAVFLLSSGFAVQTEQSESGRISVIWPDPMGDPLFILTTEDGTEVELHIDDPSQFGGIMALNRRQAEVKGNPEHPPQGPPVIRVSEISFEGPVPSASVLGSQPWINLLCKYADIVTEPKSASYFVGMFGETRPGLDHYWREVSYGNINIAGSDVYGWVTLPQTRSYYIDLGMSGMLTQIWNDCTAAADPSVYFPDFVGINLMFNGELDGSAWGGSRYASLDGRTGFWYSTWEPPWGYSNQTVLAHEMGHGFGLPHSSGDYGQTYDNRWDVMSDDWYNCSKVTDPTFGCLGQHTIAYHKDLLGWIDSGRTFVANSGIQTIALEELGLPHTGDYLLAIVPISGSSSHFYTAEIRRWTGYDVKLPGEAVILHEVDTSRLNPAHVVDIDGNGNTGDAGAMWLPGEVFNANGVSVAIDAQTVTGFVLTVVIPELSTPTTMPTPTITQTYTSTPTPTKTLTATAISTPTATRVIGTVLCGKYTGGLMLNATNTIYYLTCNVDVKGGLTAISVEIRMQGFELTANQIYFRNVTMKP